VSFWWDGARLTTSTFEPSRTLDNVQKQPKVRVSVGTTTDVLMIDATATVVRDDEVDADVAEGYAEASGIPQSTPGFVYIQLLPRRMQMWRGREEFTDRTVMRDGVWLD
jgi:general stress protein 26